MMRSNSISVIIPIHNGEKFIQPCMESLLIQKKYIQEIIIVNDGSEDNTKEALDFYKDYINVINFKQKKGVSVARNKAVSIAKGDWILFLDIDDILNEDLLVEYTSYLQEKIKEVVLVYSKAIEIDIEGNETKTIFEGFDMLNGTAFGHEIVRNRVLLTGTMVKKSAFLEVGGFDENLTYSEDWDLWLKISRKGDFKYISSTNVFIRRHKSNTSTKLSMMLKGEKEVISRYSLPEIKNNIFKRDIDHIDNITDYLILMVKLGENKLCRAEVNKYLSIYDKSDVLRFIDALLHWDENNWIQAKKSLIAACNLSIKAEYLNNLGAIHLIEENFEKARKKFEEALNIHSNYLDAHHNLNLLLKEDFVFEDIKITKRPLRQKLTSYSG